VRAAASRAGFLLLTAGGGSILYANIRWRTGQVNDITVRLETLYDLDYELGRTGVGLPDQFQTFYGGDLTLPEPIEDRAVASVNFVVRRDGIVNIPGASGGSIIRGDNPADRPLMALLRAAHDAVLVGSETLANESRHVWTPKFIFSPWGETLQEWRVLRGVPPHPLNVIVSRTGLINNQAQPGRKIPLENHYPLFAQPDVPVLVITTPAGRQHLESLRACTNVTLVPVEVIDFEQEILRLLKSDYKVSHVLIEGGPTINGAFHAKGLISDDFLTLAPGMAGRVWGSSRATLMMGHEFPPDAIPSPTLISVRRSGSHLMIRERYGKAK
jgi:riboflavin biosynthesis pyrimidine reductase